MTRVLLVVAGTKPELTKSLLLEWGCEVYIYDRFLNLSTENIQEFTSYVVDKEIDLILPLGEDASIFCSSFKKLSGWPDRFIIGSTRELLGKIFADGNKC